MMNETQIILQECTAVMVGVWSRKELSSVSVVLEITSSLIMNVKS